MLDFIRARIKILILLSVFLTALYCFALVYASITRGPISGINESTLYCFFYGRWDDGIIAEVIKRDFKMVILHPGSEGSNINCEQVSRLKEAGIVVIGYIPFGEDYIGTRAGDGSGPVYYDAINCQLVYENQGLASWYLDEVNNTTGEPPGDGIPDINTNFQSFFVNGGDPGWRDFITTATIASEGFAGTEYILNNLGCDGLFIDVIETSTPWGNYSYTWRGMFDLIEYISNLYPSKYMVANRPLFACYPQFYPTECCSPDSCNKFCFCDFASSGDARDAFRKNINALVWESYTVDKGCSDFIITRNMILECANNADGQGFNVMVLDYHNLIHGEYSCIDEQINEVTSLGWPDYISPGPLYQIGYWVHNHINNLSYPLADGFLEEWHPWNVSFCRNDPPEDISRGSADITGVYLAHDSEYLYAEICCKDAIPQYFSPNFYQMYLDTKAVPQGYRGAASDWSAEFDYLWENGKIYRYTGSGSNWSWEQINSMTSYSIGKEDERCMEVAIPLYSLGIDNIQVQAARILANINAFDLGLNDYAPDNPGQNVYLYEYESLITIDGDFSDWEDLPLGCGDVCTEHCDMLGDASECAADILQVKTSSDLSNLYYLMQFDCALPHPLLVGNFYQIFLDVDQNPSTGFNAWNWRVGAEYFWENGNLYKYAGDGFSWSWDLIDSTPYSVGPEDNQRIEIAIPRSSILMPQCNRYLSQAKPLRFVIRTMDSEGYCLDCSPDSPEDIFYQWPAGLLGDFDGDCDIDGSDLVILAADFGRTDCAWCPPCKGDFDNDGDVDKEDLAIFAADFGRTECPVP